MSLFSGNGSIEFDEFLLLISNKLRMDSVEDELKDAFKVRYFENKIFCIVLIITRSGAVLSDLRWRERIAWHLMGSYVE